MKSESRKIQIDVGDHGLVSGLLDSPAEAAALLVLGHGAGAGMRHPFMEAVTRALSRRGVATLRYQFPYMEAGKRRPDRAPVAQATVRAAAAVGAAVAAGAEAADGLPLLAGGKSFGGRMTSQAAAEAPLEGVRGLVFLGFPLHPAGRPGTERADHLHGVSVPMLFVQGTRDRLADLDLLRPVLEELGDGEAASGTGSASGAEAAPPPATLHVVQGGDHSFKVLKRSGRTEAEVMEEIAGTVAAFVRSLTSGGQRR